MIVRGALPDGRNRTGPIEMYDAARFFTVTGGHVDGTPTTVEHRSTELAAVHREYVQDDAATTARTDAATTTERGTPSESTATSLTDPDLLEKARNAANGEKFQALWTGNTAGYESHSEADMALCCLLAFWTGGDRRRMDRLFRQSGLLREKWDEVHYADGTTYGERTIDRAVATTTEFYDPSDGDDRRVASAGPDRRAARDEPESRARTPRGEAVGASRDRDVAAAGDDVRARLVAIETTLEHVESRLAALADDVARLESALADERDRRRALAERVDGTDGGWLFGRFRG